MTERELEQRMREAVLIKRFPHVVTLRSSPGDISGPKFEQSVRDWARDNIPYRLRLRFFQFRTISHPDMGKMSGEILGSLGVVTTDTKRRYMDLYNRQTLEADVASDDLNGLLMLVMAFS